MGQKIRGRLHYFGAWADPDAALAKYLREKDYLHSGRQPPENPNGLTIRDLVNRFLTSKRHLLDNRELSERIFQGYYATCESLVQVFGKERLAADLGPEDFERLRQALAKTRGPVSLGNEITRCRMVFKHAFEQGLIDKPIRYGQGFRKPTRKTLRLHRAAKSTANGKRMLEADQIRHVLTACDPQMRAMVYLGINCGFGQTDLSNLPQSAAILDAGWIEYPRPKTGIERRCPLWPETVEAVRESLAIRPKPKDEADAGLIFITKYGQRWVKTNNGGTPADALGQEFTKLLRRRQCPKCGVIADFAAKACNACDWRPRGKSTWTNLHRPESRFTHYATPLRR